MAILSECTTALKNLYDFPSWKPYSGRSRIARTISDDSLSYEDKIDFLLKRLEEHADYWLCPTREGHYTVEQKHSFWADFMQYYESYYKSSILESHSGKQFNILVCDKIMRHQYVNRDVVKMLRKIWERRMMFYRAEPNHNYESLSAADQQISVNLITEAIDIYNRNIASMPTYTRLLESGKWGRTLNPRWHRMGYCDHRSIKVAPTTTDTTAWKYGIELEGKFRTEQDMQNCLDELSKTPYDGGYLFDQRNWVIPSSDGSLDGCTGCEFVFAPFEYDKGIDFCTKVEEILKKHNFIRTTEDANAGTHCHTDAKAFKHTDNLRKVHDYVYKMSDQDKLNIYQRPSGRFCSWQYDLTARIKEQWKKLQGQFTKDNKQLGVLDETFVLNKCDRYGLVNYEHVRLEYDESDFNVKGKIKGGTVEFRGWNAKVPLKEVFKTVKKFYEIGTAE